MTSEARFILRARLKHVSIIFANLCHQFSMVNRDGIVMFEIKERFQPDSPRFKHKSAAQYLSVNE